MTNNHENKVYSNCNDDCKNCDARRECKTSTRKGALKRIAGILFGGSTLVLFAALLLLPKTTTERSPVVMESGSKVSITNFTPGVDLQLSFAAPDHTLELTYEEFIAGNYAAHIPSSASYHWSNPNYTGGGQTVIPVMTGLYANHTIRIVGGPEVATSN